MPTTALVAGATGLVGAHLLAGLEKSADYARITVVGRRAPAGLGTRVEVVLSDLAEPAALGARLACDDVFCCLGTTQRDAGSRAAFERVDYHMVVDLARACHAQGARRFFLVSALGASARSLAFYSRVKARAEAAVAGVGFDTVEVVRPSLLLGERSRSRPGEALAQRVAPLINPFLVGPLRPFRAIRAEDVADSLLRLAHRQAPGVHVHTLPLRD